MSKNKTLEKVYKLIMDYHTQGNARPWVEVEKEILAVLGETEFSKIDELVTPHMDDWGMQFTGISTLGIVEELVREHKRDQKPLNAPKGAKFHFRQRVTKIKGSKWTGKVVGFYSTDLTPIGYNVESETETGSVQLWPEAALMEAPNNA